MYLGYFKGYLKNIRNFKRYKVFIRCIRYGLWIVFAVLLFNGLVNQFAIIVLALTQVLLSMISGDFKFYENSNNSKVNEEYIDIGTSNIISLKNKCLKKGQNWSDED